MSNLVFLKYKPFSSYPINHSNQNPVLIISTLMFLMLKRKVRALYKPLKDYLKPRTDLEQQWHNCAGHLGPKTLKRLVKNAWNIIIKGTPRLKCEYYTIAYIKQKILCCPSKY
jgi:hypothetical protein